MKNEAMLEGTSKVYLAQPHVGKGSLHEITNILSNYILKTSSITMPKAILHK